MNKPWNMKSYYFFGGLIMSLVILGNSFGAELLSSIPNKTGDSDNMEEPPQEEQTNDCNCPKESVMIYSPVCGSDLKTYNNFCLFQCAQKSNTSLSCLCCGECPCPWDAPSCEFC